MEKITKSSWLFIGFIDVSYNYSFALFEKNSENTCTLKGAIAHGADEYHAKDVKIMIKPKQSDVNCVKIIAWKTNQVEKGGIEIVDVSNPEITTEGYMKIAKLMSIVFLPGHKEHSIRCQIYQLLKELAEHSVKIEVENGIDWGRILRRESTDTKEIMNIFQKYCAAV